MAKKQKDKDYVTPNGTWSSAKSEKDHKDMLVPSGVWSSAKFSGKEEVIETGRKQI